MQSTLNQTTQQVKNTVQPITSKVITPATQEKLHSTLASAGTRIHQYRKGYVQSMETFATDLLRSTDSLYVLQMLLFVVVMEIILPVFFIGTQEARLALSAAIGTFVFAHALWYGTGRTVRPLLLGSFLPLQIPLLFYLFFRSGLGSSYAAELALAIDAAQRSKGRHVQQEASLMGNYWYCKYYTHTLCQMCCAHTVTLSLRCRHI